MSSTRDPEDNTSLEQEATVESKSILSQINSLPRGSAVNHISDLVDEFNITSSLADLDRAICAAFKVHWQLAVYLRDYTETLQFEGYLIGQRFVRSSSIKDLTALLSTGIEYSHHQLNIEEASSIDKTQYDILGAKLMSYYGRISQINPKTPPQKSATFDWLRLVATQFQKHLRKDFTAALDGLMVASTDLEVLLEITVVQESRESLEQAKQTAQEYSNELNQFAAILPGVESVKYRVRIIQSDAQWDATGHSGSIRGLGDISRLVRQGCIGALTGEITTEEFVHGLVELSKLCEAIFSKSRSASCLSEAEAILELAILYADSISDQRVAWRNIEQSDGEASSDFKAYAYASMAQVQRTRHNETGSQEAASEACRHIERAVALSGDSDANYKVLLSLCLKARYRYSSNPHDLNRAIDVLRSLEPEPSDYQLQVTIVNELGLMLRLQSIRTGDNSSLDEAISSLRAIVDLRMPNLLADGRIYNNLALCLQLRYSRMKDITDNREAMTYLKEALEVTGPDKKTERGGIALNLANCHCEEFELLHEQRDIDKAIEYGEEASSLVSTGSAQAFAVFNDFSGILEQKYLYTRDPQDLTRSIEQARSAFSLVPEGHINRCKVIRSLSRLLQLQADANPKNADLSECVALQLVGIEDAHGLPRDRLELGRDLTRHLARTGQLIENQDCLVKILDLLDQIGLQSQHKRSSQLVAEILKQIGNSIMPLHEKFEDCSAGPQENYKLVERFGTLCSKFGCGDWSVERIGEEKGKQQHLRTALPT